MANQVYLDEIDDIEQIVGVRRHPLRHFLRIVASSDDVYLLHSQQCQDSYVDPGDCAYAHAIDEYGVGSGLPVDQPVPVGVLGGHLLRRENI
ncbi:MAG: hypothetical protein JWO46_1379 [Nocardioidaceae bacterium]|nr:hypothetical protein [Nocardioidaceae bacterium]